MPTQAFLPRSLKVDERREVLQCGHPLFTGHTVQLFVNTLLDFRVQHNAQNEDHYLAVRLSRELELGRKVAIKIESLYQCQLQGRVELPLEGCTTWSGRTGIHNGNGVS
jgi:hypothetical protein